MTRLPDNLRHILKWAGRFLFVMLLLPLFIVFLLKWIAPPTSSFMMQKKMQILLNRETETTIRYQWVDYDQISSWAKMAVVASEDQKFPDHIGFDFGSIRKAWKSNLTKKRIRGASTISQQVAKNLFLWKDQSFLRKGLEAYLTLLIELVWSKQRILEVYLNIAQMGDRIYGVEAASGTYFHKPAKKLSREQAALLAAILPNPSRFSVKKPSRYVQRRKAWILKQIRQLGGFKYLDDL